MPGRKQGKPNYSRDIALKAITAIEPVNINDWQAVANTYKDLSKESELRDPSDMKRYFYEKLCNKLKKPTGSSAPDPNVSRAQSVYRRILDKSAAGTFGSDEDEEEEKEEEEKEEEEEDNDEEDGDERDDDVISLGMNSNMIAAVANMTPSQTGCSSTQGFSSQEYQSSLPQPTRHKKRSSPAEEAGGMKTKNASNKKRVSAAQHLGRLCDVIGAQAQNNSMVTMMKMHQDMMLRMMELQQHPVAPSSAPAPPTAQEVAREVLKLMREEEMREMMP